MFGSMRRGGPGREFLDALGKIARLDADSAASSNPSIEELEKAEELLKSARRSLALQGRDKALEALCDHIFVTFDATEEELCRHSVRRMLWNVKTQSVSERIDPTHPQDQIQLFHDLGELDDNARATQRVYEIDVEVLGMEFKFVGSVFRPPGDLPAGIEQNAGFVEELRGLSGYFNLEPFAEVFLRRGEIKVDADSRYPTLQTFAEKWTKDADFNEENPHSWIIAARIIVVALVKMLRNKFIEVRRQDLSQGCVVVHHVMEFFEKYMYCWEPDAAEFDDAEGMDRITEETQSTTFAGDGDGQRGEEEDGIEEIDQDEEEQDGVEVRDVEGIVL
uniref:Uncharacterized protein n=1 Tax=Chromera velia CCMP2878 TaxID=1169474 RepID=A0A0G4HPC7_9ALVE|mmetsp:Transcript_44227/g.87242  ORF Transcript_44227/g.87242 Transcript_44227/m.87242 type:complete len:334 (+) Transcript_44227:180-1181(+)|eukprot:Cvel_29701.t1-p1 / transcript=Cvel_29701.t1 / gene=Cvel_29701 / organism=Chromera_velia_CCMP2878 / gene_product=hypothetical protein / transcript_product=hypothetical protein / location=Cvel_scaffold4115:5101-7564(+) / protein_length=333 / sequence_SO=supercontig / SO=protein_coding / is_pseudo=false